MKYLIVFVLLILSLAYAGYYLYMFDKHTDASIKLVQRVKTSEQIPEYLTEEFWQAVTPEQLKEELKNIKNVNEVRSDDKRSMLHFLVANGQYPEMISLLISAGVDYTLRGKKHNGKALHYAVIREEEPLVWTKEILKYDPNINDPLDRSSSLMWAVYNRSPSSVIKLLLEKGADPHFQKKGSGSNALLAASVPNEYNEVSFIDPETIQLLLDYKVDVGVKNKKGKTAFDYMKENEEFTKTDLFKKLATQFQ